MQEREEEEEGGQILILQLETRAKPSRVGGSWQMVHAI
jgi:hypothetical protein